MNETEDENAKRELQEELSIASPDPKYLFKFKYEDDNSKVWCYNYIQVYNGPVKP